MRTNTLRKFFEPLTGRGGATTTTSRFSRTLTLLGGAFLLLLNVNANAQIIAQHSAAGCGGTCTTITTTANVTSTSLTTTGLGTNGHCGSGGLSGLTNNGVTTFSTSNGKVYFTITANPGYVMNITGFTCKLRRSSAGIRKVRMAYQTTGSIQNDQADKTPQTVDCNMGATVFSWDPTFVSLPTGPVTTFTAMLYPYDPQGSNGVIQFNDISVLGTVAVNTVSCAGMGSGGTVTPSSAEVCGGTNVALSLTGGPTGSAVTYQWESRSPAGSGSWSSISMATSTSYNAVSSPTITTTTEYRVTTTCSVGPTTAISATSTVTVDPTPLAGSITGTLVTTVGNTTTLTRTGGTTIGGSIIGVWSSSTPAVGTIGNVSGVFGGISAGNSTVTFTATDLSTSCESRTTAPAGVLFAGDLALYQGANGTSTSVLSMPGAPDQTVSALTAVGAFGSAAPCTDGGLSGLTVDPSVTNYNPLAPHVAYTVTPGPGRQLNISKFWVSSRSSGTGPDSARLAYRINGGSWTDEGIDHVLATNGSCGARTNTWSWTPSAVINVQAPDNFEIAIFPYSSKSVTGTFQLQQLEIQGTNTSTVICTGTPMAGVITPSVSSACVDGFFNGSFAGDAGNGISYRWQEKVGAGSFSDIPGASSTFYTSPTYTLTGTVNDNRVYQVITTCSNGGGTNTSAVATFSVTPQLTFTFVPASPVAIGTTVSLNPSVAGGTWSSSNDAVASVGTSSTNGDVLGIITGTSRIGYRTSGFGCFVDTAMSFIHPNYISIYFGKNGNSTTVNPVVANVSASALTKVGTFGTATLCSSGGLSGMTVNTVVASYNQLNPHVVYTLTTTPGFQMNITSILATTRASGSGPQLYQIAYSLDNGANWTSNGTDLSTSLTGCGASSSEGDLTPMSAISGYNILVGVFPYGATSNSGTFQVNSLTVLGTVTACTVPGPIVVDDEAAMPHTLNASTYSDLCTDAFADFPLSNTVGGGTYSTSDPSLATVVSGALHIVSGSAGGPVTISYLTTCGTATANITIVTDGSYTACDGTTPKPGRQSADNSAMNTASVQIYPNPASDVLNIVAAEQVNVSVLSMDGKVLTLQNNAKTINVGKLANGLYMIKVANEKGAVIKTAKFTKE